MTIETGALEQGYAKLESSFSVIPADTLAATDGIRIIQLAVGSKKNREPSPEKRSTPDRAQSLPRRQTSTWNLSEIMWEPSGTLGTRSDVGKFLKAGFGDDNFITGGLTTAVAASPAQAATGVSLNGVTGLEVNDLIVVTFASDSHQEVTRIKTIAVNTTTPPVACVGALAAAGAGNVENGTHSYRVVNVIDGVDTQRGAVSNTVTVVDKTMDGKVSLTGIAVGPTGTTARKVYRTAAGNAVTGPWKLLTTIADNTTTVFTDNVADASLTTTLDSAYAVTFDTLSAAPAGSDVVHAGGSFKFASRITDSLAIYKFYNAGNFKQAVYGAVVDQMQIMFDGTKEVSLSFQGPAAHYGDSSGGATVQSKPAAHTTVGSPASGMVGSFYVNGSTFLVSAVKATVNNQLVLRNKELGTSHASGIGGRNNLRDVAVEITFYLEDTNLLGKANAVTHGTLRCLVGDTSGQRLGAVLPNVEFEIPDIPGDIGLKEITVSGVAYADSGNDAIVLGEL